MKRPILAIISLTVCSCSVGPDYQKPAVPTPGHWKEGQAHAGARLPDEWWKLFHDSTLNRLVAESIAGNQDLKAAYARVKTAQAIVGVRRADWFPQISGGGSFTDTRQSKSVETAGIPSNFGFSFPLRDTYYQTQFNLSYEADIWGKVRRNVESAKADMAAADANLDAQRLSLASEVAKDYFLLRSLDSQRAVVEDTIKSRQEAFDLQDSKFKAGLSNEVDTTRAKTELEQAKADLSNVVRQRASTEHAIAVLCGKPPADLSISGDASRRTPPNIPAGMPSDLLLRRPDVRAAEFQLISANAQIGVATAAFYPSFTLTGLAGFESIDTRTLYDWQNRILSIVPSVSVPVFTGGKNKSNLEAAKSKFDESLATYKQAWLTALREVEDAMSDLKGYAVQRQALEAAVKSAEDTERLARTRQEKGLTSYFDVVDAERTVLAAKLTLEQIDGQRMVSAVQLMKALAGGWGPQGKN